MERPLRVALVSRVRLNPYVRLLGDGLTAAGQGAVRVSLSGTWSLPWLLRQRGRVDLCHLHWLELFYNYPSAAQSARRWLSSVAAILSCRALGIRLVATVHNAEAHEGRWPRLDAWTLRLLYRRADGLHVHDRRALQEVVRQGAAPERVAVIPHGSYVGAYPDGCTRAEARRQLGLEMEQFVFLSLGIIRPYKGLEDLIAAFRCLPAPAARLLIAGQSQAGPYTARLAVLAQGDPRIYLRPGYVPDERLQIYFRAADVAVLPYRWATTSGAAYLAFAFDTPLIAPRLGPFPELAGDGRGLLYDPQGQGALAEALQAAQGLDLPAARAACRAFNRDYAWLDLAGRHIALYREAAATLNHKDTKA